MTKREERQKAIEHARQQGAAQWESIKDMVGRMEAATEAERHYEADEILEEIHNDPLSVLVRTAWQQPGTPAEWDQFEILLCTGGPACRIIGELDEYLEPYKARIEVQDWFTPWTEHYPDGFEEDLLLEYCRQFYFGG